MLDINKTCYLFFDMDNTLLVNDMLPDENARLINAARQLGHKIIVNTGRVEDSCYKAKGIDKITLDGGIFGASNIKYEGKIVDQRFMELDDFFPWMHLAMERRHRIGWGGLNALWQLRFNEHPDDFSESEIEEYYELCREQNKINPLMKFTYAAMVEDDAISTRLNVVKLKNYIDVFGIGLDKGTGIKTFCEKLGIPLSQCVSFGDSENDVDAFKVTSTNICMKDSPKALCELSTYVAKGKFGVAEGLEFLFGDRLEL